MSIIIRLQNLPWAANSVDIRQYFNGLSIPDGGVHIVGGEKGDAFIAFSTDEDARQAMERDGGKIKEIKIKLLLSSRAEMQRVIEQARNQNVSMQAASSSPTVKAAASDSDRRKVPERAPSPIRKKDKEKSPPSSGRERRKTKWDRSRSRSRSPARRSRDRERDRDRGDTDRRDRSKRDDRRSDDSRRDDRPKSSKDMRSQDPRRQPVPNGSATSGFDSSVQPVDNRTAVTSSNIQSTRLDPRSASHDSSRQMPNQRSGQPPFFEPPLPPPPNQPGGPSSFGSRNQPPQEQNVPEMFDSRMFSNQGPYSHTTYPSRGMPSEPAPLSYEDRQPLLSQTGHSQNFESKHKVTNQPIDQFDKRGPTNSSASTYDKNFDNRSSSNQSSGHLSPMRSKQSSFQSGNMFDNRSNMEGGMNYDKPGPISQMPPDINMSGPYDKKPPLQSQIPGRNLPFDNKRQMNNQMQNPPFDKRPPPNQSSNMPSQYPKRPMQSSNEFPNEDMRGPGPGREPFPPAMGTGAPWQRNHPSENKRGPWDEGRRTLLAPPVPDNMDRYGGPMHTTDEPQDIPMDRNIPPPPKSFRMDDDDSYNPPPFDMPPSDKRRMPNRGNSNVDTYDQSYPSHNQRPDNRMHNFNYDDMPPRRGKDSLMGRPRHPGGLLDRDEHSSSPGSKGGQHSYAELRGLPYDANIGLVRQFLHGISIAPEGIKILQDEQGTSTAFIKFLGEYDANNAMKRNMQYIGNSCVEVVWCPESVFDNVPRSGHHPSKKGFSSVPGYSRQFKPRMEDLCLLLKNLPYSCKEEEIVNFFDGLSVLDVCIEYDHNGKALGTAFVEFGNPDDFHMALSMNGNTIGHRYIDVSMASKEMLHNARRGSDAPMKTPMADMGPQKDHPPPPPRHPLPQSAPGGRAPLCVALCKLPLNITDHDISDFFGEVGLIPRAIHIMLGSNKLPSGEAFAEFASPQEIDCALKKNGQMIGDSNVTVAPIPYLEMVDILGGPHGQPPPPPMPPQGLLENPPDEDDRQPRRPLMRPPNKGRGLIDAPEPMHFDPMDIDDKVLPLDQDIPLMDIDRRQDRVPPEDLIEPLMGSRQMMPRMGGPRGFMRPPIGMGRPPRPMPGDRAPRMPFHGRFRPPYQDRMRPNLDLGPDKFGKPGCVLALSNVHYNAGLEELLDFFREYGLNKENLIRKYNDKGQPTGEARASFKSTEDAQKALKELNMKNIMGRSVSMVLV